MVTASEVRAIEASFAMDLLTALRIRAHRRAGNIAAPIPSATAYAVLRVLEGTLYRDVIDAEAAAILRVFVAVDDAPTEAERPANVVELRRPASAG